jgi:cytochrome c oxidase cbb3-type subunit 3
MKKYFNISLAAFALFIGSQLTIAQDGAALFKAKCNTCHMVDKNSTGPILKGVKQKWTDAGEAELIYEWVKNPQTLIVGGKSQMANAIKSFSPTEMSPQVVTNEEVDAILNYIDTYTPPAAAPTTATTGTSASTEDVLLVPNYTENLTLFYFLSFIIFILLVGIIIISTSITTLVKSDFFKKKIAENGKKESTHLTTILALVGMFGLISASNNSFGLTFMQYGEAEKGMPWLKVENMDIYFMIAINFILVGVLLYLRRMFKDFMLMARPEKNVVVEAPVAATMKKLNVILTDAVAIDEEHTILMQHEYDGIRELDNNLPPWWVWGFYATIIFAVIYLFNYHILQTSDLQIKEYDKEVAQAKKDVDAYLSKMAMNVDETNATLLTDAVSISSGKALFEANCVACHNPKGEGNIGPNLTDDAWIYSPDIKDLFKTIKLGTPNGMPEHASKMNPIQLQQAASYVLYLPFTAGKEPQGVIYDKNGKAVK